MGMKKYVLSVRQENTHQILNRNEVLKKKANIKKIGERSLKKWEFVLNVESGKQRMEKRGAEYVMRWNAKGRRDIGGKG